MKKILHISDRIDPGAGTVPFIFHEICRNKEQYSKILVKKYDGKYDSDIIGYYNKNGLRLRNLLSFFKYKRIKEFRMKFSTIFFKYAFYNLNEKTNYISGKKILKKIGFIPDKIFFYWISDFINAKTIHELYNYTKAEIYWILTDMAPMTGGCHYSWTCKEYLRECQNCPPLNEVNKSWVHIAHQNFLFKSKFLSDIPVNFISCPGELDEQSKGAKITKDKSIHSIFLPVSNRSITEKELNDFRIKHNIPKERIVIFFGASIISEIRKGFKILLDSLKILSSRLPEDVKSKITLIIAGKFKPDDNIDMPFDYRLIGYLSLEKELPVAFRYSDLFINPSLEDSGPYMINISLASGCPVVCFDIGVSKELIVNGENGYKTNNKSAEGLADCLIKYLTLEDDKRYLMKQNVMNYYKDFFNTRKIEELVQ